MYFKLNKPVAVGNHKFIILYIVLITKISLIFVTSIQGYKI